MGTTIIIVSPKTEVAEYTVKYSLSDRHSGKKEEEKSSKTLLIVLLSLGSALAVGVIAYFIIKKRRENHPLRESLR